MSLQNINIIIPISSVVNINKNINKTILIPSIPNFQHQQTYLTNTWNQTSEGTPEDFGEAFEDEEIVPPVYTDFDYAQEILEDPEGFSWADESPEIVPPENTEFAYSQESQEEPKDHSITDLG